MAGIYVHIPFCASRCVYCGFYSTTLKPAMQHRYTQALEKEMALRHDYLSPAEHIDTIYIGGGTPSQLSSADIRHLFAALHRTYSAYGTTQREVTFEANPDDVDATLAATLRECGVNRVSMGAQTFDAHRLRFLHRRHTSGQVEQAIDTLRANGIGNISIDLIYGFPTQTVGQWEEDIDRATSLGVDHISAYSLMYEEGTALHAMLERGEIEEVDEEASLAMYDVLVEKLRAAGYEHYEISNFARPGKRAVHNSSYWNDTPYMGLGAAAHSYNRTSRQWNVADVRRYVEAIEAGEVLAEAEAIDEDTHYDDLITTALRTSDGLDLNMLDGAHKDYLLKCAKPYLQSGQLEMRGERVRITAKGIFVSDMIMSDLMKVD